MHFFLVMTVFIYYVSKTHPDVCTVHSSEICSVPLCDYATINTSILLSKGIWILSSFVLFFFSLLEILLRTSWIFMFSGV